MLPCPTSAWVSAKNPTPNGWKLTPPVSDFVRTSYGIALDCQATPSGDVMIGDHGRGPPGEGPSMTQPPMAYTMPLAQLPVVSPAVVQVRPSGERMTLMWVVAWSYVMPTKPSGPASICLLYTSPSPRDRTRSRMP